MIQGQAIYIPGVEGEHFPGGPRPDLGPCNAYLGKSTPTALTGTVSATASQTLTGTATAFTTELWVGAYLAIGSIVTALRVIEIVDDVTAKVHIPVDATADSVSLITIMHIGNTDATTIKYGFSKTDLTESQNGTGPADSVKTAFTCNIEMGLTRATLERMEHLISAYDLQRNQTTGAIEAAALTAPLYERDSGIWDELHLVRIRQDVESSNPNDHWTFFRAAATVDAEVKSDAASQIINKSMFTCYRDETRIASNSRQAFAMFGNYLFA